MPHAPVPLYVDLMNGIRRGVKRKVLVGTNTRVRIRLFYLWEGLPSSNITYSGNTPLMLLKVLSSFGARIQAADVKRF